MATFPGNLFADNNTSRRSYLPELIASQLLIAGLPFSCSSPVYLSATPRRSTFQLLLAGLISKFTMVLPDLNNAPLDLNYTPLDEDDVYIPRMSPRASHLLDLPFTVGGHLMSTEPSRLYSQSF